MLVELRIRNVAVIESVTLPLASGLNVLTGETGAGKSLIVGALALLTGERASADQVRKGASRATVEGVFDLPTDHLLWKELDGHGIEISDAPLLVIKREVLASGRSRAWINGGAVTASLLAQLTTRLVSVHGQHESVALLDPSRQREALDEYAECDTVLEELQSVWDLVNRIRGEQRTLEERLRAALQRSDFLRFQLAEIRTAAPVEGEDQALETEIRRLSHAEDLQRLAREAREGLAGSEEAIASQLGLVRRTLQSLMRIDNEMERLQPGLDTAVYALEELVRELDSYVETVDVDPHRLRELEERRDIIHGLKRKYGPGIADVLRTAVDAEQELALVDGDDSSLQEVEAALKSAESSLAETALRLGGLRRSAASLFARAVTELLPELGMPDGRFEVVLSPLEAIGPTGAESIQFRVALNTGSDFGPLSRIASGGELARIMLALSTVLARLQQVPTLIFDEVDAGVGGAVAWQVGALMRQVGEHHQVLSISHLAQIAAFAHHHVVVRKDASGSLTTADTSVLEGEDRIREIARMLGGDEDREVSRAHARELLDRAEKDSPSPRQRQRQRQRRGKPV